LAFLDASTAVFVIVDARLSHDFEGDPFMCFDLVNHWRLQLLDLTFSGAFVVHFPTII